MVPASQIGPPFVWIAADGISPPRLPACGLDPIEELQVSSNRVSPASEIRPLCLPSCCRWNALEGGA